ncbi:hypothetical protein FA13DRAFT_1726843 [Coprinellus micaceus]|uniref:Uncharacterized protein n=1 Tax=Coprinellus micaceus TaxID=71717 RepID=A0A4Y7TRC9_COPMI|nr:hypothetical protein FA13DRAFT_1726843 [Coprinellus micaceus]
MRGRTLVYAFTQSHLMLCAPQVRIEYDGMETGASKTQFPGVGSDDGGYTFS